MKIILWIFGILVSLFIVMQLIVWWQDEYLVLQKTISPDETRVALLIGNHGGGGPGYCRDLIYIFPNTDNLPSITSNWGEFRNKKHLVKVASCGDVEKLVWKNNELTWKNKESIPDY